MKEVSVHRCRCGFCRDVCARAGAHSQWTTHWRVSGCGPWLLSRLSAQRLIDCSRRGCGRAVPRLSPGFPGPCEPCIPTRPAASSLTLVDSRQQHRRRLGVGEPCSDCRFQVLKHADRHLAACTVAIHGPDRVRTSEFFPFSLRVPCVIRQSITTNRAGSLAPLVVVGRLHTRGRRRTGNNFLPIVSELLRQLRQW